MDEYYRILESLPPALRTPLAKLDAHYAPHIQEIRLRLGQPVQFTIRGRLCPAAKFLPGTGLPAALETDTLRDCFLQLCRRSVYAYEDAFQKLMEDADYLKAAEAAGMETDYKNSADTAALIKQQQDFTESLADVWGD